MTKINKKKLIKLAIEASNKSYSPYSKYRVGAALVCESGNIYTGCNIENASYGATICAERAAVAKAVSSGENTFVAIAIYGATAKTDAQEVDYTFPCGICRQVLNEFSRASLVVILARSHDDYIERTLGQLLPDSFSSANL